MQTLFKLLLVTGLSTLACNCSFSERQSGNFTDTVKVDFKHLMAERDTLTGRKKIVSWDTIDFVLIRQKTDTTLKFTYYWKRIIKDTIRREHYTFNIENDSFKLVNWYTEDKAYLRKNEDFPPGFALVGTYQEKENDSIRFYKYEKINAGIDGGGALLFSPEYGLIGWVSYDWGKASLITHWQNRPVDPGYEKLFMDNLKRISTLEWEDENGRLLPGKDKKRIVW